MNRDLDISTERTAGFPCGRVRRAATSPGSVHQSYSYGYDGLNRLVSAAYSAGSGGIMPMTTAEYVALNERDYSCMYGYDVNGNVTSLRRKGVASAVDDGGDNIYITYGDIDDLSLTYDGNRLSKVSDAADELTYAGAMDFRDGADVSVEYTYDANGNMTSDLNKGISLIRYNVLNLPGYVQFADGHSVTYTYDADGNKLRTVSGANVIAVLPDLENSPVTQAALDDVGQIEGPVTVLSTWEYCGGHVYMDGRLERTLQPWGYTDADGADYFYITDYLGNVRTVTDRHGYACELNAYYPYGALMNTLTGNGTKQPYKYGGKELDRTAGLDLYDSQARFYDPVLCRTTTVDPKSAAYAGTSHYAWCAGNPTRYVDPDGEDICVLIIRGAIGHMAMLIQGDDNKWMYYSINGDNIGFNKGRPFDDIEPVDPKTGKPRKWDSPQDFLNSEYNSDGDREDKENTDHFDYKEGYVIKSTTEQDKIMRKEFRRISEKEEYDLLGNNCAHAVQRSMIKAGLKNSKSLNKNIYRLPIFAFINIKSANPTGHTGMKKVFQNIVKNNNEKRR